MTETIIPAPDLTVDTSSLLKCYGLLIIGMPLVYMMNTTLACVGLALVIGAAWWNRSLRKENEAELYQNHCRWVRRTFWLSFLFSGILGTISWMIFTTHADQTGMDEMMTAMKSQTATPEAIQGYIKKFQDANADLIFWNWIGCFSPVVLHALVRYIKGYRRADAGQPISNVKTWWL